MNYFQKNLEHLTAKKFDSADFKLKTGIDPEKVKQWVLGKTNPSIEELLSTCTFFSLSTDSILKTELSLQDGNLDIKMLVVDIDGVMTDAGLYYFEDGNTGKKFNAKDGMAIKSLTLKGFPVGIISGSFNRRLIQERAKALGVKDLYIGNDDKLSVLKKWCDQKNIELKNVAFIGDDLNDLSILKAVGFPACPADACDQVKAVSRIILTRKGGKACIREFVDRELSHIFLSDIS